MDKTLCIILLSFVQCRFQGPGSVHVDLLSKLTGTLKLYTAIVNVISNNCAFSLRQVKMSVKKEVHLWTVLHLQKTEFGQTLKCLFSFKYSSETHLWDKMQQQAAAAVCQPEPVGSAKKWG